MEKVLWMESVDLVYKTTFTRIQTIKLPPKLLNPLKILKRQLKKLKPILRLGLVLMAMSVVSFTPTPYLTLLEVPTATDNTVPMAATLLVTVASATVLKVLMEQLKRSQQSRPTSRPRAPLKITQQSLQPFLPLR